MEIQSVVLRGWNRDEGYRLLVNGQEIAHANYEEDGSGAIGMLERIHDGLARLAGIYPVTEDGIEDEEDEEGDA
jgi:hypothetical protein